MITRVVNINKEPHDVYIGRGSKWGNPFTTISHKQTLATEIVETSEEAITKYRDYILSTPELYNSIDELDGKVLGCFCMSSDDTFPIPYICHGQVLVDLIREKKLKKLLSENFGK
jgi:hypothetical protein